MLKKILAVFAAIGGFFSAIFYVLMKEARTERKLEEAEAEARDSNRRAEGRGSSCEEIRRNGGGR